MNRPTLRAIARLLAPWRTIRRLEDENLKLSQALGDSAVELLSQHLRSSRLRLCPTHGQQPPNAWGCPKCVRELRQENERLRSAMATAREAVRRITKWGGDLGRRGRHNFCIMTLLGVVEWADNGMEGPLPPLPEWVTDSEAKASSEERH